MAEEYGKIIRFPIEKTKGPFGEILTDELKELNNWISNFPERIQIEGQIIYLLFRCGELTFRQILEKIGGEPSKVAISLATLVRKKSIVFKDFVYFISEPEDGDIA